VTHSERDSEKLEHIFLLIELREDGPNDLKSLSDTEIEWTLKMPILYFLCNAVISSPITITAFLLGLVSTKEMLLGSFL
jgi:hypothetical protein